MEPRRTDLLMPWLLLSLAAIGILVLFYATYVLWPTWNAYGKGMAVIAVVVGVGALVALAMAFFSSILLPIAGRRREEEL